MAARPVNKTGIKRINTAKWLAKQEKYKKHRKVANMAKIPSKNTYRPQFCFTLQLQFSYNCTLTKPLSIKVLAGVSLLRLKYWWLLSKRSPETNIS